MAFARLEGTIDERVACLLAIDISEPVSGRWSTRFDASAARRTRHSSMHSRVHRMTSMYASRRGCPRRLRAERDRKTPRSAAKWRRLHQLYSQKGLRYPSAMCHRARRGNGLRPARASALGARSPRTCCWRSLRCSWSRAAVRSRARRRRPLLAKRPRRLPEWRPRAILSRASRFIARRTPTPKMHRGSWNAKSRRKRRSRNIAAQPQASWYGG